MKSEFKQSKTWEICRKEEREKLEKLIDAQKAQGDMETLSFNNHDSTLTWIFICNLNIE